MTSMDAYERFLSRVDSTAGPDACHLWTAATDRHGYGRFGVKGKTLIASRWLLGHLRGEPLNPEEMALHHCDNPPCVNPHHLYVGDAAQNMRDKDERNRNGQTNKTHCKRNHEFTEDNTYHYRGKRHCRTCRANRDAGRQWTRREAAA